MSIIVSRFGSAIGQFFQDTSYWAVKLHNGSWISQIDLYPGLRLDHPYYDWSLDMVGTHDVLSIDELWLFCPKNWYSPMGNTGRLKIMQKGTAFQFQGGKRSPFSNTTSENFQIIGRVDDTQTGACTCFVWDGYYHLMVANWHTNINNFQTWDREVSKRLNKKYIQHTPEYLGPLSKHVVGLDFSM